MPLAGSRINDMVLPAVRLHSVKIDWEGRDAEVLKGMQGIIDQAHPLKVVKHPGSAISS